jgi:hypothetical protein
VEELTDFIVREVAAQVGEVGVAAEQ